MNYQEQKWGDNPIQQVDLKEDDRKALCTAIEDVMTRRHTVGALKSEADFLCGAMAVMERLGITCPVWPILIMTGRSIFDIKKDAV